MNVAVRGEPCLGAATAMLQAEPPCAEATAVRFAGTDVLLAFLSA